MVADSLLCILIHVTPVAPDKENKPEVVMLCKEQEPTTERKKENETFKNAKTTT